MPELKKLTLLHTNDLHGDFLEDEEDGKKVGGISMLSGYVNKVRSEGSSIDLSRRFAASGFIFSGR